MAVQHGNSNVITRTKFQFSGFYNDQPNIYPVTQNSYVIGESTLISGDVKNVTRGNLMTVEILNPDHNLVDLFQAYVMQNGYYADTIPTGGPLWIKNGTYTIIAQYDPTLLISKNFIMEFGQNPS